MSRHVNIPVFIPHLGCPNQCVFCNQRTISGVLEFKPESVRDIIDEALSTLTGDYEAEIAFFGGSFTGIERALMVELLEIANTYILSGRVKSIRCSTRPDYIDDEVLDILEKYGVKVIELGLQSVDPDVLLLTKRGHTLLDEERACKLIVERGFSLVGQMMLGLPGSTIESETATADFIINAGACAVRIYPTVVFYGTELAELARNGGYQPLSNEEAAKRAALLIEKFKRAGVNVIRVGLCSSENLSSDKTYFMGPNHSALGELAEGEVYYLKIKSELLRIGAKNKDKILVLVPKGAVSKATGQKKKNKLRFIEQFGLSDIKIEECSSLSDYEVMVKAEGR